MNKAETIKVLRLMRELLSTPTGWTQGEAARTPEGTKVAPSNKLASCFCLFGAHERAINVVMGREAVLFNEPSWISIRKAVKNVTGLGSPVCFNDAKGRRHAEVLAVIDGAITIAEAA